MSDPSEGEFPENVVILEFFDMDDFIPLAGKIVLAMLKLYPDLAYADSPVPGEYRILPEDAKDFEVEKVVVPRKPFPAVLCEVCERTTRWRFFLTKRIKIALCKQHMGYAAALVFCNPRFYKSKDHFLLCLQLDMLGIVD